MVVNEALRLDKVTPAADSEEVKLIAAHLNLQNTPELVKRTSKPKPCGNCYWNVEQVARESGGGMALGWAISIAPNVYIEALHHGVWRMSDGRLIDVTEPENEIRRTAFTLFIQDERKSISIDRLSYIDNEYVCLTDNAAATSYIELYKKLQTLRRQRAELLWEAGYRCEHQLILAKGGDPTSTPMTVTGELAGRVRHLIESITEIERQRESLRIVLCEIQDRARISNRN